MTDIPVDVPQELLDHLAQSGLSKVEGPRRVRVALAIVLFASGQVSIGRAAELAGYPLVDFQELLRELDMPVVVYDREEYERDQKAADLLRERLSLEGDS